MLYDAACALRMVAGAIVSARRLGESNMDARLYLTIASIIAILYGIAFVLLPGNTILLFGGPPEVHVTLNLQFFGSGLLGLGVIGWFARDFRDWDAVRGVLIGYAIVDVIGGLINIWATMQGLLNSLAWSSTAVYALLLIGALYCLSGGERRAT